MVNLTSETKLLAKHSSIYALGGVLTRLTAFLLLPVYTRYLTPFDYGVAELTGFSTQIIGILIATSISTSIMRIYFTYDNESDRNEVVSTAMYTLVLAGLLLLVIVYFAARPISKLILDDSSLYYLLWISFASMWVSSINNITSIYLRATQQSVKVVGFAMIRLLASIGINLYLVVSLKMGVTGVLLAGLLSEVFIFLIRSVPLLPMFGFRISQTKLRKMLRFGLPLIPAELCQIIVNLSDRYFIRNFMTISDAGIYSMGYRFSVLPSWVVGQAFNNTWQPRRLEIFKQENASHIFSQVFTYFMAMMILSCLGIAVLIDEVLILVVDPNFWNASEVVPLLVLANLLFGLPGQFAIGLIIAEKTKYIAYINAWTALIVLLCNYILISRFGLFGAAYATIIASAFKAVATYIYGQRFFKINYQRGRLLKLMIVAAMLYAVSLFIKMDSVLLLLVVKLIWVLTFPLWLLAIKFFSPIELEMAKMYLGRIVHHKRNKSSGDNIKK